MAEPWLMAEQTQANLAMPVGAKGGPVQAFAPEVLLLAQPVRVVIFDVDGVLTDGSLYVGETGEAFKAFCTLDGAGIKMLWAAHITPCVITGRDSPAVRRRVAELGIAHAAFGVDDKLAAAEPILAALNLGWNAVAAMGDDWIDLPMLERAALAVAPPGAHIETKASAHYVTTAQAGHGAARECCDLVLIATGHYARLLRAYRQVASAALQSPRQP